MNICAAVKTLTDKGQRLGCSGWAGGARAQPHRGWQWVICADPYSQSTALPEVMPGAGDKQLILRVPPLQKLRLSWERSRGEETNYNNLA